MRNPNELFQISDVRLSRFTNKLSYIKVSATSGKENTKRKKKKAYTSGFKMIIEGERTMHILLVLTAKHNC